MNIHTAHCWYCFIGCFNANKYLFWLIKLTLCGQQIMVILYYTLHVFPAGYCWIVWLYFGCRLWFLASGKAFNWWLNKLFKWKTRRENVLILFCSFQSLWRFICKSPLLHVGTYVWPVLSTSAVFIYLHVVACFLPVCLLPCNTPARVILRIAPFIDVWAPLPLTATWCAKHALHQNKCKQEMCLILCFSVQVALFICNKSGCLSYLTSLQ